MNLYIRRTCQDQTLTEISVFRTTESVEIFLFWQKTPREVNSQVAQNHHEECQQLCEKKKTHF
jgi:hypothetical protein